jgi:putative membrane-bound dehydrogenase-like protein
MIRHLVLLVLAVMWSPFVSVVSVVAGPVPTFTETFDDFDPTRFLTTIPNRNTVVRDGVLWTRGESGGKYPPMVYLPVEGADLALSFRYRHLGDGGSVWFFVDGDDGFGGVDHMLRVKLLRSGVHVQVDGHTKDASDPLLQKDRAPDPVSGAYRTNEFVSAEKRNLSANEWHTLSLVFTGSEVTIRLDESLWRSTLARPGFVGAKRKLLWMMNGGEAGIELDDILVGPSPESASTGPEPDPSEFPRVAPLPPGEALASFEMASGFSLALAAAEPDVIDPIAMCFDEKGRAYVLEMRDYSERREEALGRVRLLTDDDGDGKFDRSSIFRENLKWPTAITCYRGGVFVAATPDVYFFRDNDGDEIADETRTVFTGFGEGPPKLNMQALCNSFRWGPDNRIWGATAANGGMVRRPDNATMAPISLRGADFSFDPESTDLRAENGTAQYGLSFDSLGRRFVCSNSRHLIWVAYERAQVLENPWFRLPPPLVDIPVDGAAAPVYRISPDEPWRIVRTRWRVAGVSEGQVEGGGRVSGYFTSASGAHVYWGDAFPPAFRDSAFIADVGSNLVHHKRIVTSPEGASLTALRFAPEAQSEFLRSRDNWFRPTSFASGPDGCLYLTDMYREVIEHPWSIPEGIKKHLDLNSGNDRGRIYRIAPTGHLRRATPDLGAASDDELEVLLLHDNDWHRTTARRLLYERGKSVSPMPPVAPFPAALSSEEARLDWMTDVKDDPWMIAAVLHSFRREEDLRAAWRQAVERDTPAWIPPLGEMIARSRDTEGMELLLVYLSQSPLDQRSLELIDAVKRGFDDTGKHWDLFVDSPLCRKLCADAQATMAEGNAPLARRLVSVKLLARLDRAGSQVLFREVFGDPLIDPSLLGELVNATDDMALLIESYARLPENLKTPVGSRILESETACTALFAALREGKLPLTSLPAFIVDGLRSLANPALREEAARLLPPVRTRADIIAEYEPSLADTGDAERGKAVFARACAVCHVSQERQGIRFGPDAGTFSQAGSAVLLGHILDPNREVAPQYQAFQFSLADGRELLGLIISENATEVTVRQVGGAEETFRREKVSRMTGLRRSLMPEGFEASIGVAEMADLLAYLVR